MQKERAADDALSPSLVNQQVIHHNLHLFAIYLHMNRNFIARCLLRGCQDPSGNQRAPWSKHHAHRHLLLVRQWSRFRTPHHPLHLLGSILWGHQARHRSITMRPPPSWRTFGRCSIYSYGQSSRAAVV